MSLRTSASREPVGNEPGAPPLTLVLLPYATSEGATNMAIDEAMMDLARNGAAALRFYGWDPPCLSLGRNQPAPARLLGRAMSELEIGIDVVRRPTGGRAVFHGPEVTYAFACPDRALGGPRAVYERIHRALATGLTSLGVALDPPGARSAGPDLAPGPAPCFQDPAPGELTVEGRKLVGSAQWRHRRAILQHGSILLSNRQAASALTAESCATDSTVRGAIGLDELLERVPDPAVLSEHLGATIERELAAGHRIERAAPPTIDSDAHVARYRSQAWQRRV